jgi:hypothetical protein
MSDMGVPYRACRPMQLHRAPSQASLRCHLGHTSARASAHSPAQLDAPECVSPRPMHQMEDIPKWHAPAARTYMQLSAMLQLLALTQRPTHNGVQRREQGVRQPGEPLHGRRARAAGPRRVPRGERPRQARGVHRAQGLRAADVGRGALARRLACVDGAGTRCSSHDRSSLCGMHFMIRSCACSSRSRT